ncbi:MAG: extracellular solute-binding protein [Clostridium sp.]|jgi:ABC-type glycerol-3-phosphate transport system substrate-binding protein|nr:extracellular solute-binding protein [Clostridium sp.]
MNRKKTTSAILAFFLATGAAGSFLPAPLAVQAATALSMDEFRETVSTYNIDPAIPDYQEYLAAYPGAVYPARTLTADAGDFVRYEEGGAAAEPQIWRDYEGMSGESVLTGEDSLIEFEIAVPQSGLYNLGVVYYPVPGKNADIQRGVFVDGKLPYEELYIVSFPRIWTNYVRESYVDGNGVTVKQWEKDNQGNDVKPKGVESPEWQTRYLYDNKGYITSPLSLYLEKGVHTVSFLSIKEPMLIRSLVLSAEGTDKSYAEKKREWEEQGARDTSGKLIVVEGEYASRTSSQMLYPQQDQSSPSVSPASAKELLNNTIGGNSWRLVGQWIEWEFQVEEAGYYLLSLYDRQNLVRGINVSRRITIDGEVPFAEMAAYAFAYGQDFREDVLEDESGEPYRFYLAAGKHTLRMEAVLGGFSRIVGEVETAVQQLQRIYREVIMITGVKPDTYRDYQIAASFPDLNSKLAEAKALLDSALAGLEAVAGKNTDKKAVLLSMRDQLVDLMKDEEYFVRALEQYRINVRACGNWIAQVIGQPLEIDRIHISSPDRKPEYRYTSFWAKVRHEAARLFYSFVIDYNQIGDVAREKASAPLTLWVGTGRDQANIIKSLLDESFTNQTGIPVNVQLVDMSTLLKASLVGEGPDVAVQVANTNGVAGAVLEAGNDTPVNYGIRNAVWDLAQFEDLEEVAARYPEAAIRQFAYDGSVYALPETITYPVMFYRKDILAEIGLDVPETWEDVQVAMTVLAKNQMEFGMRPTEQLFASILYQNGGSYYLEDASASALDSDLAVNTFKTFCEYYSDYRLDKDASVEERFRTGECPLIIADYTVYNNFAVSAPDIAGLWSFTQIPGTRKEDGTVDHSVACTGLASMILSDTEYPEESWELLKWWTSEETQTAFGREMERLMGAAARVPTANYAAFLNMPWPTDDFEALKRSMEWARGIPQVPGGYYSWRNVNNAFWAVVVSHPDTSSPREELMDKVIYINGEIAYKQEELRLGMK